MLLPDVGITSYCRRESDLLPYFSEEGDFVSQIWNLTNYQNFKLFINEKEGAAWKSFAEVIHKSLGNFKDAGYKDIVENCLNSFRVLECNMSIKVNFLFNHFKNFPDNLLNVSDEQDERFHQEIKIMEARY